MIDEEQLDMPEVMQAEPAAFSYPTFSLAELAECVSRRGDEEALVEIHQRTPFHLGDLAPVGLIGLIDHLRRRAQAMGHESADRAYDLTVDRFSRLAPNGTPHPSWPGPVGAKEETDCRRYFEAYVKHLSARRAVLERASALEREMLEAKALLGLVRHHYSLALREIARRSFMTRFVWQLPSGPLVLLMPRSISGRARRQWLESNVPNADSTRPHERERVQEIIDEKMGQSRTFSFRAESKLDTSSPLLALPQIPGEESFAVSVEGLAECVAQEKAARISEQRPAVQALGSVNLRMMIHTVFEALADSEYSLDEVAKRYGISKPTLSRFAGIRWKAATRPGGTVPDLWRNTAKVIGSDPEFVEAAKRAGVWQRVEQAAEGAIPWPQDPSA